MVVREMIKIESQNAQIGIERQDGQLDIKQNQFPMNLKTKAPELNLQIEYPVVYIDQRQCFSEAGLKNNMDMSKTFYQKGKQAALQAISRIASEGRAMANIQNGSVIARLAEGRSKPKEKPYNFDMIPKSSPIISVEEGKINGHLDRGEIDIKMDNITPQIDYKPAKVEIYIKQKQSINIQYIGENVDTYGG